MAESAEPEPRSSEEVRQMLDQVTQVLRSSPSLSQESRQALADLVEELGEVVSESPIPAAQVQHLTESVAHLLHATQPPRQPSLLSSARDRLDRAIAAAEAESPMAVGLVRRLLALLDDLGI